MCSNSNYGHNFKAIGFSSYPTNSIKFKSIGDLGCFSSKYTSCGLQVHVTNQQKEVHIKIKKPFEIIMTLIGVGQSSNGGQLNKKSNEMLWIQ